MNRPNYFTFIILAFLALGCVSSSSDSDQDLDNNMDQTNIKVGDGDANGYDPELAEKLQADDYGMKQYVFALLKSGPNRDQDSTTRAQIQRAHMDNITRMADAGQLVAAGPFIESGEYQGIYIFNVVTVEEALELTQTDPAVQAGRLEFEFYPWYSSATLQLINDWHKKVAKVEM